MSINLRYLNCSNNKIEYVNLSDNIEIANLDKNRIKGKLEFKPNMKILSINKNLIDSFHFKDFPRNLNKLYLNNNLIEKIIEKIDYNDSIYMCPYIEIKNNPLKDREIFEKINEYSDYDLRYYKILISRSIILI
jgi:Leucine-rich repeat (LRR) protein